MEIPGIGPVSEDSGDGRMSKPIAVPAIFGQKCRFSLLEYDNDPNKEDFHTAIENFLSIDESVLKAAEEHMFAYYRDNLDGFVRIKSPSDVWSHLNIGYEATIQRGEDGHIYISFEGGCDWEDEHGLQTVFKNGLEVTKVGPWDGHVTNSEEDGDVVYVSRDAMWRSLGVPDSAVASARRRFTLRRMFFKLLPVLLTVFGVWAVLSGGFWVVWGILALTIASLFWLALLLVVLRVLVALERRNIKKHVYFSDRSGRTRPGR